MSINHFQDMEESINWEFVNDESIDQKPGINMSYRNGLPNHSMMNILQPNHNQSISNINSTKQSQRENLLNKTRDQFQNQAKQQSPLKGSTRARDKSISQVKFDIDQDSNITPRTVQSRQFQSKQSQQGIPAELLQELYNNKSKPGIISHQDTGHYNESYSHGHSHGHGTSRKSIYQSNVTRNHINRLKKIKHFADLVLIFTYATQFLAKMKKQIYGRVQVRQMDFVQIDAIHDRAHDHEQYMYQAYQNRKKKQKQQQQKTDKNWICCCLTLIPIIKPNLKCKMFFDCYQGYLVLFRMYFTTIKYVYFATDIRNSIDIIKSYTLYIINISFILDMLLTFHTGYYENGVLIMDRKKIAVRYLKGPFLSDLICQIPMVLFLYITNESTDRLVLIGYVLESLIFFKIFGLKSLFQRLERVVTETETGGAWWPLMSLITKMLILAHIIGCSYFLIGLLQIEIWQDQHNWIQTMDTTFSGDIPLIEQGWFYQYLHSVFWSFSVMVSNIMEPPKTKIELIFSCVIIITMTGTLGYVINTIGIILDDIEKKNKKYRLEREMTNRFLKRRQISEKLRERVSLYLDYIQKYERKRNFDEEQQVLQRMPEQLKKQVIKEINQDKIDMFKPIQNIFSEGVRSELLLKISNKMFSQGDVIFHQHSDFDLAIDEEREEIDGKSLYVVYKGRVELYQELENGNQVYVGESNKGDIFGDLEFFTGNSRKYTSKAAEACNILKIRRQDFLQIIQKYPKDYQIFCMIKDKMIQYNNSDEHVIKCSLCFQSGHLPKRCPKLHLTIDVKQLIYDYNTYDIQIKRMSNFERLDERSHHALIDMEDIKDGVDEIYEYDDTKIDALKLREQIYNNLRESKNFDLESSDQQIYQYQQMQPSQISQLPRIDEMKENNYYDQKKPTIIKDRNNSILKERRSSQRINIGQLHNILHKQQSNEDNQLHQNQNQNQRQQQHKHSTHLQTINDDQSQSSKSQQSRNSFRQNTNMQKNSKISNEESQSHSVDKNLIQQNQQVRDRNKTTNEFKRLPTADDQYNIQVLINSENNPKNKKQDVNFLNNNIINTEEINNSNISNIYNQGQHQNNDARDRVFSNESKLLNTVQQQQQLQYQQQQQQLLTLCNQSQPHSSFVINNHNLPHGMLPNQQINPNLYTQHRNQSQYLMQNSNFQQQQQSLNPDIKISTNYQGQIEQQQNYDIDLKMRFDIIKEWDLYFPQHNFKAISKIKELRNYFLETEEIEKRSSKRDKENESNMDSKKDFFQRQLSKGTTINNKGSTIESPEIKKKKLMYSQANSNHSLYQQIERSSAQLDKNDINMNSNPNKKSELKNISVNLSQDLYNLPSPLLNMESPGKVKRNVKQRKTQKINLQGLNRMRNSTIQEQQIDHSSTQLPQQQDKKPINENKMQVINEDDIQLDIQNSMLDQDKTKESNKQNDQFFNKKIQ